MNDAFSSSNDDMKLLMVGEKEGQLGIFIICNLQGFRGVNGRAGVWYLFFSSRLHFAHVAIIFPFADICPFSLVCWSLLDGVCHFFLSFSLGVMGPKHQVLAPGLVRRQFSFSSLCRTFFHLSTFCRAKTFTTINFSLTLTTV